MQVPQQALHPQRSRKTGYIIALVGSALTVISILALPFVSISLSIWVLPHIRSGKYSLWQTLLPLICPLPLFHRIVQAPASLLMRLENSHC